MDPKRPGVQLDERPDEEGVVTRWDDEDGNRTGGLFACIRRFFGQ